MPVLMAATGPSKTTRRVASDKPRNNDSIGKTLLVVIVLCLVCSVVVAGAAVGLKAKQQEQRLLDKQRNILAVAGLLQPRMPAEEVQREFALRIEPRLLDLQSGAFIQQDPATFDRAQALRSDQMSIALTPAQDIAGIRRRASNASAPKPTLPFTASASPLPSMATSRRSNRARSG